MKKLLDAYLNLYEQGIEISPKTTTMGLGISITDKKSGQSIFLLEQFKENVRPVIPITFDLNKRDVTVEESPESSDSLLEQYRQGNLISLKKLIVSFNPVIEEIIKDLLSQFTYLKSDFFLRMKVEKELPVIIESFKGGDEDLEPYIRKHLHENLKVHIKRAKKRLI